MFTATHTSPMTCRWCVRGVRSARKASSKKPSQAAMDIAGRPELQPCSDLLWILRYLLPDGAVRPIMGERRLGERASHQQVVVTVIVKGDVIGVEAWNGHLVAGRTEEDADGKEKDGR